jgi:DNA-binding NtrC family response regulator
MAVTPKQMTERGFDLVAARAMIEAIGYSALSAKSGLMALEIFKTAHQVIDLVILDMIMPEMSGMEVFEKMRRIDPHVRVILSSGYSMNGQAIEIMNRGCNGFIQKPFNIQQLSEKIHEILDSEEKRNQK